MNIIILGPAYPLRGGIAHHTALLSRELGKKHDVQVITFKRQYPKLLFPGKTQKETSGELLRVQSEELLDSVNPFNWIAAGWKIRARAADLLIFAHSMPFFGPCYGTIAAIARWRTRTKTLYLCHNIVPHEPRWGDTACTKYAFRSADYFLVQSQEVEQDLLRMIPRARYVVSPHPIYELFGEALPKGEAKRRLNLSAKKVLLFFGYVRRYKGLGVLIEAMKYLLSNMNDVLLLVVGEFYEDESQYRQKVKELGLESCIRFVSEYVPQEDVATYFSAADLVVLPYLSATQSGIAQVAYNFSKPVIATDVGGLSEVVRDNVTGYLVPSNDPQALAQGIRRYYEEQRENEFAANVQKEKGKYSWAAMTTAIENLVTQQ
jgi:glycosyltransferase involved in cell wall biosynthesis